jgi:DNA-binding transcriptional MocR family regulator
MAATDKVERYLRGRKRPVTSQQIADYFMYRRSTVQRALHDLEQAGKATRTPQRTWHICRMAVPPVAAPAEPEPALPRATYDRPTLNSYPHARGYDD